MRKRQSLDAAYFDGLYSDESDPWGFETSAYEAAKYDHTIAALGDERAIRALEVGCSIGVLTRRLAAMCDHLLATELAQGALDQARRRCTDLTNVNFRLVRSADESFDGVFDLIVLSEVVYYWDDADLERVARAMDAALVPGGRVLLVHWLGETDYPKSADDATSALLGSLFGLDVEHTERCEKYRLDVWRRKL